MAKSQFASAPRSKPANVARSWAQIVRTGGAETSSTPKQTATLIAPDMKQVDVLKHTEFSTDILDDEAETQFDSIPSLRSIPSENNESDEERCDHVPVSPCRLRLADSFVAGEKPKPLTKLTLRANPFVPRMSAVKGQFNVKAHAFVPALESVLARGAYSTPYMNEVQDENKYNTDYGYSTPVKRAALNRARAVPPGLETPLKTSSAIFIPNRAAYPLGKPAAFAYQPA